MRVRYRVDGVLQEMMQPPVKMRSAIMSRLKIMSELDIAERRVPAGRAHQAEGRGEEGRPACVDASRASSARRS